MPHPRIALATLCAIALTACVAPQEPAPLDVEMGVVIQDVTVVDTRDGQRWPHRSVVIEGSRIVRVAPARELRPVGAARVVDGRGRYVVPGFLDMHTHALPIAAEDPTIWAVLVAHGITGIREMAGSPELIAAARRLNAEADAGRVDAPEVLAIPGPLIVGAGTAQQGRALVDANAAMGADFVKLIAASREASLAILDEAKIKGLPVAGHLPPALGAVEAAQAGWHSIEHLGSGLGVLVDCSADEATIRADVLRDAVRPAFSPLYVASPMLFRASDEGFYRRVQASFDAARCDTVLDAFERHDTWQVPTLIRLRGIERSDDPALVGDPDLAWVDPATRALWTMLARRYGAEVPASARQAFADYYGLQQRLVGRMAARGVRLMAGSDLGGIWVVPGAGLHREFHELATAGLTPLQVLQATTLNGAAYLHRETTMGSVAAGRRADLVLLDGDPIADVANLDRVSTVVLRGKVLDADALAAMKTQAAATYARRPARDPLAALANHGHAD